MVLSLIGLLLLTACQASGSGVESGVESGDEFGVECPDDLSFVRPQLVTPTEAQAEILGPDTVEQQLTEPIDDMIERGGGIEPSITSAEAVRAAVPGGSGEQGQRPS